MSSPQTDRANVPSTAPGALRWSVSGVDLDFALAPSALADIRNDLRHRRETAWGLLLGSAGTGKDRSRFVTVHESVPLGSEADSKPEISLADRVAAVDDLVLGWCMSQQLPVHPVGFYIVCSRREQPRLERELPALEKYGRDHAPLLFCIRPGTDEDGAPVLVAADAASRRGAAELPVPIDFSGEWREPLRPEIEHAAPPKASETETVLSDEPAVPRAAAPSAAVLQPVRAQRSPLTPLWVALGAAAVILGAAGWWLSQRSGVLVTPGSRSAATAETPAIPGLDMQVSRRGGDLEITWNRTAPAVQSAQRGILNVIEGRQQTEVPLEEAHLRTGRVLYVPRSSDIEVRLEVIGRDGAAVRESLKVIIAANAAAAGSLTVAPPVVQRRPAPSAAQVQPLAEASPPAGQTPSAQTTSSDAPVDPPKPGESAAAGAPRRVFVPPAELQSSQPVGTARIESTPELGVVGTTQLTSNATMPQTAASRPALPPPADQTAIQQPANRQLEPSRTAPEPARAQPAPVRPLSSQQPPAVSEFVGLEPAVPVRKVPVQLPPFIRNAIRGEISVPVTVQVDEYGKVMQARVTQQQGSSLATYLSNIAKNTAEQWRFKPAARNGVPIPSEYTLVFRFTSGSSTSTSR